jgi:hypothetical protein
MRVYDGRLDAPDHVTRFVDGDVVTEQQASAVDVGIREAERLVWWCHSWSG